jgi:ribosomal protein L4
MTETEDEVVPIDLLVKIHTKIKSRIDALTKDYDTAVEQLKAQQDEVRFAIKDKMKALGLKSVNTSYGTVSLSTKVRYNTQDWDSFKKFILEHQVVDLLEKRIAQTNMATFLSENPGVVPPGLNSHTEFEIRVTKSK